MAAALVCLTVVLFFFKDFLINKVILAPAESSFYLYRLLGVDCSLSLVSIEVAAQFMTHMKVTLMSALILSFPYIVYELWRFVAPALYINERRALKKAFLFAGFLFYLGLAVGYLLIVPLMVNFFAGYQISASVPNTFSLTSYVSLLTSTVLIFGLVFQFPTVIAVLSSLGIVTKCLLKRFRRHAVCAVVILAALITPSGDPFSLLVCSVPLYLLYEFSILICKEKSQELVMEDE